MEEEFNNILEFTANLLMFIIMFVLIPVWIFPYMAFKACKYFSDL